MTKQKNVLSNVRRSDGSWTESAAETLEALFTMHFPGCNFNTVNDTHYCTDHGICNSVIDRSIITKEKIEWAINTLDQIAYDILNLNVIMSNLKHFDMNRRYKELLFL